MYASGLTTRLEGCLLHLEFDRKEGVMMMEEEMEEEKRQQQPYHVTIMLEL